MKETTPMNDQYEDNGSISLMARDQYIREVTWIQTTNPLREEEEVQLLRCLIRAEEEPGNAHLQMLAQNARERLVEGYQYLVLALARRVYRDFQGMELLDLVNEGNFGLFQAIEKYPQYHTCYVLRVLATVRIRYAFASLRYGDDLWAYVPHSVKRLRARVWKARKGWRKSHDEDISVAELACQLGESEACIEEILCIDVFERMESIQGMLREDEAEDCQPFTGLYAQSGVDEGQGQCDLSKVFEQELTACQREVLEVRHGFGEGVGPHRPLEMVAELLGVSVQCVHYHAKAAEQRLHEVLDIAENGYHVTYQPSFSHEEYYDSKQAARIIGVGTNTLFKYVQRGIISVGTVRKSRGGHTAFFFLKQTVHEFAARRCEKVSA